jgi:mono/diheme cytochrome c family protein
MAMIKTCVLGIVLGMCLPVLAGYLFLTLGGMPVTTTDAPLPFERYLAKKALKVAMRKEIGKRAPMPPDDTNFLAGAKVYREQCAVCHGLPNQPRGAIAKGMSLNLSGFVAS